jgi:putative transposase
VVLSQVRHEKIYLTIQAVHEKNHCSISLLCQIAGIPRSSYYKWLKRKVSPREQENQQLIKAMILLYDKVEGIYGYRRLTDNLRRETDQLINHKRV